MTTDNSTTYGVNSIESLATALQPGTVVVQHYENVGSVKTVLALIKLK